MKVSTKGRYGLRILLDIALHGAAERPRVIREIAQEQGISEKYISRLIIELRRAGLLQSVRGYNGGYVLSREPESVTILEVVEVMEGPMCIVECADGKTCGSGRIGTCLVQGLWAKMNEGVRRVFAGYTLRDLMNLYACGGALPDCL